METITTPAFFMWATLINLAILLIASAGMAVVGKSAAAMQSQIFRISEEQVYFGTYIILGVYKMMILVFLAVPWIVLSLI